MAEFNQQAFQWGQQHASETPASLQKASGPPLVAHCIVGQARGFTSEHVWRSIRENVVGAFGGRADIFMVLKHGTSQMSPQANMLERRELLRPDSAWRESLRPLAVRVLDGQSSDESSLRPKQKSRAYARRAGRRATRLSSASSRSMAVPAFG